MYPGTGKTSFEVGVTQYPVPMQATLYGILLQLTASLIQREREREGEIACVC